MSAPEQRNINWGSAEIENATLSVELTGASSKAWKQRFESVLTLLDTPHRRWGEIHVNKKGIRVADVQPGTEPELRHFLESIVLQVDSELPEPEEPGKEAKEQQVDRAVEADRRLTAGFRALPGD